MEFFDPVYEFFGAILAFFYGLIPNLGVSIILLTVLVMLVLFPLTAKQAKAMMHMQRAQPEIKKLQAKYKHDRQKLNEEVMKFYQANKINPLAGCLPLLVQMPIFFALFNVMRNPYKYIPTDSDLYAAFCDNGTRVVGEKRCGIAPLPNHLEFLGMDLSQHATGVTGGFLDALPYFLLVGGVIVTAFLQSRQSRRNAPNMTSQMAMISTVLPIAFGLFSLQFPAGLVLYFLVSNLWRLGQQELIMRKITGPMKAEGAIEVKGTDKKTQALEVDEPPPAKTGGLRKLFQPAPAIEPGAGTAQNGGEQTAEPSGNGAPKPKQPAAPRTGTKPRSPTAKGGRSGGSSGGTGQRSGQSNARKRNNKRKKRR
jgi:YidC/Oxa1 family membrane protein insertase